MAANTAHAAPGTKTAAAGKPNDGAASVNATGGQGHESPSDARAEVAVVEDGEPNDDDNAPIKKRAPDGTGKTI